jgi:hypothetical protein
MSAILVVELWFGVFHATVPSAPLQVFRTLNNIFVTTVIFDLHNPSFQNIGNPFGCP